MTNIDTCIYIYKTIYTCVYIYIYIYRIAYSNDHVILEPIGEGVCGKRGKGGGGGEGMMGWRGLVEVIWALLLR